MKRLLTYLLFILPLGSYAQTPGIEWQKTYGGTGTDEASVVRPTNDGGYIVTGLSNSANGDVTGNHGAADHWVMKLNSLGAIQWKKSYGGSSDDKGYDIRQTTDGGYIFIGYTTSNDGNVTGNHGSTDYWVVKINDTGLIQWQKAMGGSGAENGYNVIQTLDGGYATIGLSSTTNNSGDVAGSGNHGGSDYWLTKLDASGTIQWTKSYGGAGLEQAFGIVQNADSSYVLCGYSASASSGDVTDNHGGSDYWIVKVSPSGVLIWQRSYGGTGADRAFNICKTTDGGYVVNGASASTDGNITANHGGNDYWVIKLNDTGGLVWQRSIGGTGDDFGRSVQQTLDGGYVLGGRTNTANNGDVTGNHGDYDYWVVKLNDAGAIKWQKCFGGTLGEGAPGATVPFTTVTQLADGKYIMAGCTYSNDGDATGNNSTNTTTDDNYWIVKLQACPAYGSITDTICHGAVRTFNNMTIGASGIYYDTLIAANGCDSILALRLTVRPALAPTITANGGNLSTGAFAAYQWLLSGQIITGATSQNYTATSNGDYRVVVIDLNGCRDTSAVSNVHGLSAGNTFTAAAIHIYPNPVIDKLDITLPIGESNIQVSICSVDGRVLQHANYARRTTNIVLSTGTLAPGVYLLQIGDDTGETVVKKLIKN